MTDQMRPTSAAERETKPIVAQNYRKFREQLGVSESKFYWLLRNDPDFPKPFKIGGRKVLLVEECNQYVRRCLELSR